MEHPFAEGMFRNVARGVYTSGERKNQACVIKWFKGGHVSSRAYYKNDIKAVYKALEIIEQFNQSDIILQHIRLNIPEVWEFGGNSGLPVGTKILIEPFIDGFRKCTYMKFCAIYLHNSPQLVLTFFSVFTYAQGIQTPDGITAPSHGAE